MTESDELIEAREALAKANTDMARTVDIIHESQRLVGAARDTRRANHFADKWRLIIQGVSAS